MFTATAEARQKAQPAEGAICSKTLAILRSLQLRYALDTGIVPREMV